MRCGSEGGICGGVGGGGGAVRWSRWAEVELWSTGSQDSKNIIHMGYYTFEN